MADEVYKILQSRLRRNAQHTNCGDQPDCDVCRKARNSMSEDPNSHAARKKARAVPPGGEDPLSHKIIEKRRRDRMNSQLADLSHLIPSNYLKKGRGRIEKTEIVEMAIKHIKHLHQLMDAQRNGASGATDESADGAADRSATTGSNWQCPQEVESFRNGFNECTAEAIHFLVDKESYPPENQLCTRLVSHLNRYLEQKNQEQQQQQPPPTPQQQQQPAPQLQQEVVTHDSDYSSFRSEGSSATSSEVGSAVSSAHSQTQGNGQMNHQQRNFQFRHFPSTSSSVSLSESQSTSSGIKRRKSEEVTGSYLKFKDSIRERFGKEFEQERHSTETPAVQQQQQQQRRSAESYGSAAGNLESTALSGSSRKRPGRSSSEHFEDASNYHHHHVHQSRVDHHHHVQTNEYKSEKKSVPIFALHPKGSHYIPLEVSDEVIKPYLHLFDQGSDLPLMLHPVTISVNFCGPVRMASRQYPWPQKHKTPDGSLTVSTIKEDKE